MNDNELFRFKDFYCKFIDEKSNENILSEKERKYNTQLNVYIKKGNETIKVNTLTIHKELSFDEIKDLIVRDMCTEIGKIKEDGTIEKEYYGQGYIYKNYENFYKREGICYVSEYDGDKVGDGGVSYDEIREEVIHYLRMCYVDIDKVPEKDIEDMIKEIFEAVDWQFTCTLISGDEYLDDYVEGFPKEYFIKKEIEESEEEEI